jgi:hypothetical protein
MPLIRVELIGEGSPERCDRLIVSLSERFAVSPARGDADALADVTIEARNQSEARKQLAASLVEADPRWWEMLSFGFVHRVLTANESVEVAKRDAHAVIGRTRAAPESAPAECVVSFADHAKQGLYTGPEGAPLLALLNDDAYSAWLGGETAFDAYVNTFEIELERATVRQFVTISPPSFEGEQFLSLYVVDGQRFPTFNEKVSRDGDYVMEMYAQQAFRPPKRSWLPWRR